MTQTFWLSFCDSARPKGQRFLGCCIVDVTDVDMLVGGFVADDIRAANHLPPAEDDVRWLAGAVTKSHVMGCNPGGEVASARIDQHRNFATLGARYPRNRLLSRAEVEALEPPEPADAVDPVDPTSVDPSTRREGL